MSSPSQPLARAYAACEALAQSHYENFPVASRLLPAFMRPHVAAVYAFARVADDIADEGTDPPAARRSRLQLWQQRLHHAVEATEPIATAAVEATKPVATADALAAVSRDALIIAAAAHSIRTLDLPLSLFDDLVSAFAQDITTTRYDSWSDVLDYCRRSAEPVGRLVLRIADHRDAAARIAPQQRDDRDRSADALCAALQLTNFWQDFGRDWRAGRLYVPRDISTAAGALEADLGAGRVTPQWIAAIDDCIARTRQLFDRGRPVCDGVSGRLRFELRLTWLGGVRILDRVAAGRADLLRHRPTLGTADVPALFWRALRWKAEAA